MGFALDLEIGIHTVPYHMQRQMAVLFGSVIYSTLGRGQPKCMQNAYCAATTWVSRGIYSDLDNLAAAGILDGNCQIR